MPVLASRWKHTRDLESKFPGIAFAHQKNRDKDGESLGSRWEWNRKDNRKRCGTK